MTLTAGAAIGAGKAVRFSGANTVVEAANSSLSNAKIIGVAESAANNAGDPILITLEGGTAEGVLVGATPNETYYLSSTGGFTTTPPTGSGDVVMQVGYAATATDLFLAFGVPYERT